MTLKILIEKFKEAASKERNVNYVGVGDVYKLNELPDVDYSVVWLTESQHSITVDTSSYGFTVFYIDRQTDAVDNTLKVHSDGMIKIQNILNRLTELCDDEIEIQYPISFTPFNQRFADDCTGLFCSIKIDTDNDISMCVFD